MNSFQYGNKMYARPIHLLLHLSSICDRPIYRFEMSRAVDDYTVPSPVASLQATSTPLVQKKVRPPHCLRHTY